MSLRSLIPLESQSTSFFSVMAITGKAATFAALRLNSPKDHSCLLAGNRVSLRVPTSPNPEMAILVSAQGNLSSLRGGTGLLERPTFDQSQFDPVPEAQEENMSESNHDDGSSRAFNLPLLTKVSAPLPNPKPDKSGKFDGIEFKRW